MADKLYQMVENADLEEKNSYERELICSELYDSFCIYFDQFSNVTMLEEEIKMLDVQTDHFVNLLYEYVRMEEKITADHKKDAVLQAEANALWKECETSYADFKNNKKEGRRK